MNCRSRDMSFLATTSGLHLLMLDRANEVGTSPTPYPKQRDCVLAWRRGRLCAVLMRNVYGRLMKSCLMKWGSWIDCDHIGVPWTALDWISRAVLALSRYWISG